MQRVRETVSRHLGDLGAHHEALVTLDEAILRDGPLDVAVRFRAGEMIAMWNLQNNRIQFYDSRGCRLRTISVS